MIISFFYVMINCALSNEEIHFPLEKQEVDCYRFSFQLRLILEGARNQTKKSHQHQGESHSDI